MDKLSRGTALAGNVRIFCCRTTELVAEAAKRHDLWPTSAAALGRLLSVGCVMGAMLKDRHEKIEIQMDGKGVLGKLVVDAYCNGKVRGFVTNPHVNMTRESDHKLDVGGAVGTDGVIRVVKDLSMKQPFISEVEIQSGEIGDDFAYYYASSEQTPSAVSVGVLVNPDGSIKSAGSLVIQMMPSATETDVAYVEHIVSGLKPISQIIDEMNDPTEIVKAIFEDYEELGTSDLRFKCECSKGRFAQVIAKLPVADLTTMLEEDNGCEVVCHFCNNKYEYGPETLQGFITAAKEREKESNEKCN